MGKVEDAGLADAGHQALGDEPIVDAPSCVVGSGVASVAPPGVGIGGVGVSLSPYVGEACLEELGEFGAFVEGEACVVAVGVGVFEVYFVVSYVHVAAGDHGFFAVEADEVVAEVVVPCEAVGEAPEAFLGVGRVDVDEEEAFELEGDEASFVVVLFDAESVADVRGCVACEDGCSGIAFLVGIVPVAFVAWELHVDLSVLEFCFL